MASSVGSSLLAAVLPVPCAGCEVPGWVVCPACVAGLRPPPPLPCPEGVEGLRAAFAYEGVGRHVVARLKYRRRTGVAAWLAPRLAALSAPAAPDMVTFVPTSALRRRRRGFDHAEALAVLVAGHLGCPAVAALRRGDRLQQTGRPAAERHGGPRLEPRGRVAGRVLVVDDVVTTGASLSAAATVLREAGAAAVEAVVAAATPPPAARR